MALSANRLDTLYGKDRKVLSYERMAARVSNGRDPVLVWHYASPAALLEIIRNGALWATDIYYMNDAQEVKYGISFICDYLAKRTKPRSPILRRLFGKVLDYLDRKRTQTQLFRTRRFFSISFSTSRDDLNLWRGYSDKGVGFSIGFRKGDFSIRDPERGFSLEWMPIVYDTKTQGQLCEDIFATHEIFFDGLEDELSPSAEDTLLDYLELAVTEAGFFMKNPAFAGEQEWRLLYWGEQAELKYERLTPSFRATSRTIVPYVSLSSRKLCGRVKLPIARIIAGPQIESKLSAPAIKELLRRSGYTNPEVEVVGSGVPFRAL